MPLKKQATEDAKPEQATRYARPAGRADPIIAPRQAVQHVTSLPPRSRWDLYVHGWRWTVEDVTGGPMLVPLFRRIPREAGVGGMAAADTPPGAPFRIDSSVADANAERAGWRKVYDGVLPSFPVICSDGYDTTNGGRAWLAPWERPVLGTARIEVDRDLYAQFVAELLAAGVVQPPMPSDLEEQAGAIRDRAQQAEQRAAATHSPASAARAKHLHALADALQAGYSPADGGE